MGVIYSPYNFFKDNLLQICSMTFNACHTLSTDFSKTRRNKTLLIVPFPL